MEDGEQEHDPVGSLGPCSFYGLLRGPFRAGGLVQGPVPIRSSGSHGGGGETGGMYRTSINQSSPVQSSPVQASTVVSGPVQSSAINTGWYCVAAEKGTQTNQIRD